MKKTGIITIGLFVSLMLSLPSAWAGSKQRHRWEGAAMAVGAAAIGGALLGIPPVPVPVPVFINNAAPRYQCRDTNYCNTVPDRRYRDRGRVQYKHDSRLNVNCRVSCRNHCCGRWEVRKVWVPPSYERVWNPGHYNRRNEWVPGAWIRVQKCGGYWTTERVWVSSRR